MSAFTLSTNTSYIWTVTYKFEQSNQSKVPTLAIKLDLLTQSHTNANSCSGWVGFLPYQTRPLYELKVFELVGDLTSEAFGRKGRRIPKSCG